VITRRPRTLWKLALVALALAALPASALAAGAQAPEAQDQGAPSRGPFGGMIDLQPGAINGQVTVQPGSVSVQGMLRDPGVEGQIQVNIPGQFVGTASATNGQLAYNLAMCGAGVALALSGTSTQNVRVGFQDAASNPAACSAAPAPTAQQTLVMGPLTLAQAEPATSGSGVQDFLLNWLRRLIGFSLVALLLVLLIPAMPKAIDVATETSPWGRLGIGVAVAIILPLIGILLFAIGLPVGLWWLGVIFLALYPVLLILSLGVSGLALGSWLNRRAGRPGVPPLAIYAVAMIVLAFLSLLPYVGPIVNVVAVAFGLGTLVLAPRSHAPAAAEPTSGPAAQAPATPDVPTSTVTSEPVAA
jgi:hypothetical protein